MSAINWTQLAQSVAAYDIAECRAGLEDAVFSSLRLKTSDLQSKVAGAYGHMVDAPVLNIFVDTLEVDDPLLPTAHLTIVARRLLLGRARTPIHISKPDATGVATAQILTRDLVGGALTLASGDRDTWDASVDGRQPTVITYVRGADHVANDNSTSTRSTSILDLVRHPMAWNTFKATFQAAAILVEQDSDAMAEGISMLQWVYACTRLIAAETSPVQAEAQDLAFQSSSLLVLLSGSASAPYVPLLSQHFYQERIAGLLSVVQSYEQKSDVLQTQTNIEQAVKTVTSALGDISKAEGAAIQVSIDNTQNEVQALIRQYGKLLDLYKQQTNDVRLKKIILQHALEEKKTWGIAQAVVGAIEAVVSMVGAVGSIGIAPEATPEAAGAIARDAKAAASGAESATQAAKAAEGTSKAWSDLAESVAFLQKLQDTLGKVLGAGASLYGAAKGIHSAATDDATAPDLTAPDWAEMATTDPTLQWTLFASRVDDALKPIVDAGVDGAADYLNSLKILVEYGKALNTKAVALAVLEGHSLELKAQADAAQFAQQRWAALSNAAATIVQKQAALQALLGQHLVNAKRSLFLCAKAYAAAYYYRYLVKPTFRFSVTMTHAELTEQCARIQTGIEQLLTTTPPDQTFDTNYFTIPIASTTSNGSPSASRALLNTSGSKPQLSWSIPIARPPFDGTVPNSSNVGVFIEEAWFYLVGAKPNHAGTVMLTVSTSGAYSNGYGQQGSNLHFISPAFTMNFIYNPASDGTLRTGSDGQPLAPTTPWRPADPQSYLNPSPFTEWLAVINDAGDLQGVTAISMRVRGVYHQPAV